MLYFAGGWNEGKPVPRGGLGDDDDVETTHILPDKADMFLAFATVPGYRCVFKFRLLKIV